jgi:hypothetical protein
LLVNDAIEDVVTILEPLGEQAICSEGESEEDELSRDALTLLLCLSRWRARLLIIVIKVSAVLRLFEWQQGKGATAEASSISR